MHIRSLKEIFIENIFLYVQEFVGYFIKINLTEEVSIRKCQEEDSCFQAFSIPSER